MPSIREQLHPTVTTAKVNAPLPVQPKEQLNEFGHPQRLQDRPIDVQMDPRLKSDVMKTRLQNSLENLFGKDIHSPENLTKLAKAAGAIPGSKVTLGIGPKGGVLVKHQHEESGLLQGDRDFHRDDNGDIRMNANSQFAHDSLRGGGVNRFKDTLGHLRDLGVKRIDTHGVGELAENMGGQPSAGGHEANGYYTWPRFGFNGELRPHQFNALPEHIKTALDAGGKRDFHSLFSIPSPAGHEGTHFQPGTRNLTPDHELSGAGAWMRHGSTAHVSFHTDPDSQHSKNFEEYASGKQAGRSDSAAKVTAPNTAGQQPAGNAPAGAEVGRIAQPREPQPQLDVGARYDRGEERPRPTEGDSESVARYAGQDQPSRTSVITGTHLEHALNNIVQTARSGPAKALAYSALNPTDDHLEHIATVLPQLHRQLREEGHPLANAYNWHRATEGLYLDHAMHHAAETVASRYPELSLADAKSRALIEMFNHHLGASEDASFVAQDAIDTLKRESGSDHDDITKSLERTFFHHTLQRKDPSGQQLKAVGESPRTANIASPTRSALKFARPTAAVDFRSALQRVNSRLGDTLQQLAKRIHEKLKLQPSKVHKAVHDDPTSSTATTVQSIYHDDPDKVTSAAAHYGLLTETPSIAVFRSGEGPDSVHHFKVNGSGEKLRHQLDAANLEQRVLVPAKSGYNVFILDRNSEKHPLVQQFTNSVGTKLNTVKGMTELIGGGDEIRADKDSRRDYRNVLQQQGSQ